MKAGIANEYGPSTGEGVRVVREGQRVEVVRHDISAVISQNEKI